MTSPQLISLCTSTVETAVYRDFMEWFGGLAGDQTVATLPQSEAFVQAGAADKSVVEFDRRGKAAKATLALVGTVREAAGFPKE